MSTPASPYDTEALYAAACARLGRTTEELIRAEAAVFTLRRDLKEMAYDLEEREREILFLKGKGGGEDGGESAGDPVGYTAAVGQAD